MNYKTFPFFLIVLLVVSLCVFEFSFNQVSLNTATMLNNHPNIGFLPKMFIAHFNKSDTMLMVLNYTTARIVRSHCLVSCIAFGIKTTYGLDKYIQLRFKPSYYAISIVWSFAQTVKSLNFQIIHISRGGVACGSKH